VSWLALGLTKMDMSWDDSDDELCFLMEETIGAVRGAVREAVRGCGDLKVSVIGIRCSRLQIS
jgi:hypothetical protein